MSHPRFPRPLIAACVGFQVVAAPASHAQDTGLWRVPLPDPNDFSWTKAANWEDQANPGSVLTKYPGEPGGPGSAAINRGTANLTEEVTLSDFSLGVDAAEGATLTGSAALTVNGTFSVPTSGVVSLGAALNANGPTLVPGILRINGTLIRATDVRRVLHHQ